MTSHTMPTDARPFQGSTWHAMYVHLRVPALNQERTVAIVLRPSDHQHILEEIQRCVSDMTSKISCAVTAETPDDLTKQLHSLEESVADDFKDFKDRQERLRLMREAELITANANAAAARERRHRPERRTVARVPSIRMPRSARQRQSRSEEVYVEPLPNSSSGISFRRRATEQNASSPRSEGSCGLEGDYQGPRWWQAMRAEVEARKRAEEMQPMARSLRGSPSCPVMSQRASPEEPMRRNAAPEAKQRGFTSMNAALARCWALSKRSLRRVRPSSVPRPFSSVGPTDS